MDNPELFSATPGRTVTAGAPVTPGGDQGPPGSAGSAGTPGGPQYAVQINNPSGTLYGDANFTYNSTTKVLGLSGLNALYSVGTQNWFCGQAGNLTLTGSYNIAVGPNALLNITTGNDSVAIGAAALRNQTAGGDNTAIGTSALATEQTGNTNTAIGSSALTSQNGASNNVGIGQNSGWDLTTGYSNIIIGTNTHGITTGSGNIIIGTGHIYPAGTSNVIILASAYGDELNFNYNHASAWDMNGRDLYCGNIYGTVIGQDADFSGSITLAASDTGKIKNCTASSAVNVTCPNSLPKDFYCTIHQASTGQITFVAGSGAAVHNRQGLTKSAGQYALCSLIVSANSGGSAAVYTLGGDCA